MEQIKVISARIKELRTFNDYSKKELAKKIGISEEEYDGYESGLKDIPIGIIYHLATALDIEPEVIITGQYPEESVCSVSYDGTGIVIHRHPGYRYISLAEGFKNKQMKPMIVTIEPNDDTELFVHEGQEFNYVLEGKVRLVVGEKEYFLREGDSAYFDPQKPHAQYAMNKKAKFLTVINE